MAHRIVLVDDHHMVRQGLVQLIGGNPEYVVSGEAETATDAIDVIVDDPPDLVIADLVLGTGPDGIQLTKGIKAEHPLLPVLVLSGRDESLFAERALLAGAAGYIMKDEAVDVLFSAIQKALAGSLWISDAVSAQLLPASVRDRTHAIPAAVKAEALESGLVRELRRGNRTVFGLARGHGLGPDEVDRDLDRLCATLQLPSRAALFLYLQRY